LKNIDLQSVQSLRGLEGQVHRIAEVDLEYDGALVERNAGPREIRVDVFVVLFVKLVVDDDSY